jgi:hypothetical protein
MFTLIIALESNVTRNAKHSWIHHDCCALYGNSVVAPLLAGESAIRIPGRTEVPLQQPNILLCAVA